MEMIVELLRQRSRNALDLTDGVDVRFAELGDRAKMLQKQIAAFLPDAGDIIQFRPYDSFAADFAVIIDGEPVRLIPYPLEQIDRRGGPGNHYR